MDKKIVFVPYPLLNYAEEKDSETAREVIKLLLDHEIGLIQMPSVENDRRTLKRVSKETISLLKKSMKENYKVLGILGIEFSPIYGVNKVKADRRTVFGKGVFVEELEREMQNEGLQVPIVSVNLGNVFSTLKKLTLFLKNS